MLSSRKRVVWASVILLAVAPKTTYGQSVIIQTFPGSTSDSVIANDSNEWLGQAFTTGTNAYSLVDVRIEALSAGGPGIGAFALFSNNGNRPGLSLMSLGETSPLTDTAAFYTLRPSSAITLAANTTYWLVGFPSSGRMDWTGGEDPPLTGSGTVPVNTSIAFSPNRGDTWITFPLSIGAFNMEVRGDAVISAAPEPTSAALVLSLFAALGLRKRRSFGIRTRSA
jgi:hypothetical protein